MTKEQLYDLAAQLHIPVDHFPLQSREALSLMDTAGNCFIALDPGKLQNEADERTKLSHELGHCATGAFYNRYATCDNRRRHENTADKWAVQKLVDLSHLDQAIADGCTEIWELAEHFGVTEPFMRKAVCYYVHGNLATELYF